MKSSSWISSDENRQEIFRIHLTKRGLKPEDYDLAALAGASSGFSGSEIEQTIVSSMYAASALGRQAAQDDILEELSTRGRCRS